ncbi:DUF4238 domain-containing protein [Nitrosomonas sp.]|uniref:DUF4238 domain-containing protein n=1 Tax=Nitrosomonas sp. TaxID=42353 RepID=UPI0025FA143B|nr:DUF4238 domain-containing protein [Nitrosomonas sp.]
MAVKPISRRHHYLPQSYLAAFTDTGLKGGQFFVLDIQKGSSFRTSPLNVGVERDFNRVDVEGYVPDAIENALAPFEGEAIDAIRRVINSETFPTDSDCNLILNLLGLIAVRNPKFRGSFNRSREQMLRRIADLLVSNKEIWDCHVEKARVAGEDISGSVSFGDAQEFVKNDNYSIEFHPQENLRVELHAFDELLPLLGQRTWSVLVAPSAGPEFICSDHPVTLARKSGQSGQIGFGVKETEVFFPFGRHVGFYGVFESSLKPVVQCKPGHIALMNKRVAWNSKRHVYSSIESFFVWHEGQVREVSRQDKSFVAGDLAHETMQGA